MLQNSFSRNTTGGSKVNKTITHVFKFFHEQRSEHIMTI